jgi:hypothetical protein
MKAYSVSMMALYSWNNNKKRRPDFYAVAGLSIPPAANTGRLLPDKHKEERHKEKQES